MDTILPLWKESGLVIPGVLLGFYGNKYYITTSDDSPIIFFASSKGKIYVAIKNKSKVVEVDGVAVYQIEEQGALQVISCKRVLTKEDQFVVSKILPTFPSL